MDLGRSISIKRLYLSIVNYIIAYIYIGLSYALHCVGPMSNTYMTTAVYYYEHAMGLQIES